MQKNISKVADCISTFILPFSFKQVNKEITIKNVSSIVAWKRKTWNTNRSIVLLEVPDTGFNPLDIPRIKKELGKKLGYMIFLYPLGLQLIFYGANLLDKKKDIFASIDKYDNQRVVLQSIFLIDTSKWKSESASTWGQYISGKWQDAIARGIDNFFASIS